MRKNEKEKLLYVIRRLRGGVGLAISELDTIRIDGFRPGSEATLVVLQRMMVEVDRLLLKEEKAHV